MSVAAAPTDNFEAAFALLAAEDAAPVETPAAEPATVPDTPPAAAAETASPAVAPEGTGEPAAVEPATQPAASEAPPASEPAPAAAEPPEGNDDELLQRLAALVKKTPTTAPEPAAPPPAARPAAQSEEQAPEIYTADEKQLLETYEKDWSEVSKAEGLKRRAEYNQLTSHIYAQIAQGLKPYLDTIASLAERTHLTDLRTQVGDYDTIRDQVISWATSDKQPTYLRKAYNDVINGGTPEEIADMVRRFRTETGQQAAPAPAAVPAKPVATELPAATKQAVAALAPVSSKRSAVVQQVSPDDFDGAFAAFADKV